MRFGLMVLAPVALIGGVGPAIAHDTRPQADAIITGGMVYDGSAAEAQSVDIVVMDGLIVRIGSDAGDDYRSAQIIDAGGLIVAPGFIDPHTHAGSDLVASENSRRANLPYLFQGVTTVVVGNDGRGSANIADLASQVAERGIGNNVAYLVGFSPVRESVLAKDNRAPDTAELAAMETKVETAMCEGAWGFSTGLYYVPQAYSQTSEVIALAKIAARHGGYYDTHLRDESTYNITVTGAVNEAIEIGREANLPVHIAHIKALGPAVWGHSAKMIDAIEKAQAGGLRVTADQYPWTASGTRFSNALVPRSALEGGLDGLRQRLADPAQKAAIRAKMIEAIARRGGAEKLLVTGLLGNADIPVGKTLAELAVIQRVEPVDAALATLEMGDARIASFNMNPDDISAFAKQDWVITGSDGSNGHPRKYGSFPKAYQDLVQGEAGMSMARFIQRSSSQAAEIIGLPNRGYLREGYAADIVIFDPDNFAPTATYQSPRELSNGVRHLFVNGVPVIRDGTYTKALPGEALLKDTEC